MWGRFFALSQNWVIFEGRFFYDKKAAQEFCDFANPIMEKIQDIRRTGARLFIAHRFMSEENRKKVEKNLEEKEQEMQDLFKTII